MIFLLGERKTGKSWYFREDLEGRFQGLWDNRRPITTTRLPASM
jgi:hypothetical protein